ncbi:MAG: alpha/beta hydrolase [Rhizobacter sp.]
MTSFDPAWLDVQYNNRARIPEHAQIFERWALASARVREGMTSVLDVPYGEGPNETLDVFPAAQRGSPVLVFIHGGWWRSRDKSEHSFVAASLVAAGAMVVVPNYALCPGTEQQPVDIEMIALQMVRALAWVYRNAATYGGRPGRIVVAGHSAGAHLAAMMLCCDWQDVASDLPSRVVHSALAISGVFDLEPIRQTPFLQADLRLTHESVDKLSPAYFRRPPGRLFAAAGAGESEEFLRQNKLIQQAWGTRTVPVCETIPDSNHLTVLHDLADPEGRLNRHACELLDLSPHVNPEK